MELEENKKKLDDDKFEAEFKVQEPLKDDKIKSVLATLAKIAKDDTFLKAQTIEKSEAVKKLLVKFDKDKAKPAEVKKLKGIFYDDYSQDREDFLYDAYVAELTEKYKKQNKKVAKRDINKEAREMAVAQVINDERKHVIRVLRDKNIQPAVAKVKETIKIQLIDSEKNKNSNNMICEPVLDLDLVEQVQKEAKNIKWDESLGSDDYYLEHEDEFAERRSKIISEIKKKKQDKFLRAFDAYEKVNECAANLKNAFNIMNRKSTDTKFGKINDWSIGAWTELSTKYMSDVEQALKEYITACQAGADAKKGQNNNMGAFVQLGAVGVAMFNRIKNLEATVNNLVITVNALIEQLHCNAKMSPEDVAKVNKKVAQKSSFNEAFIPTEKWVALSNFEKFSTRFRFKDFSQNPPRTWWNSFSEEEKAKVIRMKVDWQKKRLVELAELYSKDEDTAARFIDSFFHYEFRDKFGCELTIPENLKKELNLDESSKLIYDDLKDKLESLSKKRLVYNKVIYNNVPIKTKGYSSAVKIEKQKNANVNKGSFYSNSPRRGPFYGSFNEVEIPNNAPNLGRSSGNFLRLKRRGGPIGWGSRGGRFFNNSSRSQNF